MKKYFLYSILYLFGIGIIFLFNYDKPDSVSGIFLTSIISLPFYFFLLTKFDYRNNLPLQIYIFMSSIRVGLVGLYIAYVFSNGTYLNLMPILSGGYGSIYFGGLILVIGDIVFIITCFSLLERRSRREKGTKLNQVTRSHSVILRNGVIFLIMSIFFTIINRFINFANISHLIGFLGQYLGPSGLLLLAIYKAEYKKLPFAVAVFAWIFIGITVVLLSTSFWKQTIIIYLLPLGYLVYRSLAKKGTWKKITCGVVYGTIGLIVIVTIFSYVRNNRYVSGSGTKIDFGARVNMLVDSLPLKIVAIGSSDRVVDRILDSGILDVLCRFDLYTASAWVYSNVQDFGYKQNMIDNIGRLIIPRVLFPTKEPIHLGKELAVELGQAKDVESANTSSTFGMFPAYYRNFGWVGVILGAFFSASWYSVLIYYSCSRYLHNPIAMILYFSLIVESLRWFEAGFCGGIPYFLVMSIAVVPLSFVYEKIFLGKRGWKKSTQAFCRRNPMGQAG